VDQQGANDLERTLDLDPHPQNQLSHVQRNLSSDSPRAKQPAPRSGRDELDRGRERGWLKSEETQRRRDPYSLPVAAKMSDDGDGVEATNEDATLSKKSAVSHGYW